MVNRRRPKMQNTMTTGIPRDMREAGDAIDGFIDGMRESLRTSARDVVNIRSTTKRPPHPQGAGHDHERARGARSEGGGDAMKATRPAFIIGRVRRRIRERHRQLIRRREGIC